MDICILLYDGMTALDAIGPYEILSRLPGARLRFVAERTGEIRVDTGVLGLTADASIDDVDRCDLLLVPGGNDEPVRRNDAILAWVRKIDATTQWTTSVCTGALILAAAGLLEGRRATTHFLRRDVLADYGATATPARVVEDGKFVTAAGVSAGIDMALRLTQRLVGDDFAQAVQLGIEYDPQPPFDSGSPEKAPRHIVELVTAAMRRDYEAA